MGDGHDKADAFASQFAALTGYSPLDWQKRLFHQHFATGKLPSAVDVPTGLGKTSVMAIWLIARALGKDVPRRLVYVVDRRVVVDQATTEAMKLRDALAGEAEHFKALDGSAQAHARKTAAELNNLLGFDRKRGLPISTLRGAYVDNREWLNDPSSPAIIIGTVDMIGSRLLFEGYGVSRKMRPYQAGLLGIDALVLLDEAHLVPPFAHLLRAIEQDPSLRPKDEADRSLLPRFVFLPLSATQREPPTDKHERRPFRLEEGDWKDDEIAKKRLNARKSLRLEPLADAPDTQLAAAAMALARKDNKPGRVVVFCDRRDKKEGGRGPSAEGVADAIKELAKGDKKTGRVDIHDPERLVGARRVHEREIAAKRLCALGFIGKKWQPDRPTFLVATAAGEVGVDIDADHMVCDLVAWERMVQRLGRVNRRGEGDAEVWIFWSSVKNTDAPSEAEKRVLACKTVIEKLPKTEGAPDASPCALRHLTESARTDNTLKQTFEDATTPELLRPAFNRALVDAWSMTSLEKHTGRPDVAAWLRGWVDEIPQTTIAWRKHLPMRIDEHGRTVLPNKTEIEDFFEAAPLHESEKLETEAFRVVECLQKRAVELTTKRSVASDEESSTKEDGLLSEEVDSTNDSDNDVTALKKDPTINSYDIVAITLTKRNNFDKAYTLADLAKVRDGNGKKAFEADFYGRALIVDARIGGLDETGLLNPNAQFCNLVADKDPWTWTGEIGFDGQPLVKFRIEDRNEIDDDYWKLRRSFTVRPADDPNDAERLYIFKWDGDAATEDDRSILGKRQALRSHSEEVQRFAEDIAIKVAPSAPFIVKMLGLAAKIHDQGKARELWQQAMGIPKAPADPNWPYAKTDGRGVNLNLLKVGDKTFRHEFASLMEAKTCDAFEELAEFGDLALHLIAAHHGFARPYIFAFDPKFPPSETDASSRDIVLRYARLQRRWGPWGLAWWEALLRAADQRASRNEKRPATYAEEST